MQTDWKKDIDPPRSCAFSVTAAAPNHTITKTAAKTREALSPGAVRLRTIERRRQTRSGPQRSPEKKMESKQNALEEVVSEEEGKEEVALAYNLGASGGRSAGVPCPAA